MRPPLVLRRVHRCPAGDRGPALPAEHARAAPRAVADPGGAAAPIGRAAARIAAGAFATIDVPGRTDGPAQVLVFEVLRQDQALCAPL